MPLLPAPQLQTLPSIFTNNVQPIAFLKPLPFIFLLTESHLTFLLPHKEHPERNNDVGTKQQSAKRYYDSVQKRPHLRSFDQRLHRQFDQSGQDPLAIQSVTGYNIQDSQSP